jgi:integrase
MHTETNIASNTLALTDRSIDRMPLASEGQYIVRDAVLRGLYVVVGKRTKSWTVQGDLRKGRERRTIKISIGATSELGVKDARTKGSELLELIRSGTDPRDPSRKVGATTLRDATDAYIKVMERKGRSDRSIWLVKDLTSRVLANWMDETLISLGRDRRRLVERHDALTAKRGPYAANHAMRAFRAIYNEAMRVDPDLPPNPIRAVTFNTEQRRNTGMGAEDLSGWWLQLNAMLNPIRREFHLLTLLSGSRPEALRTAKWEHLDARRRMLRIPKPKGGERRAFDIPLSRQMILALVRVRRAGIIMHPRQAATWIFPADSATGHIVEHKEDRSKLSKWGGDLRQSFRNMCALAGIDPLSSRLLMNHVVDRDVHDGYITKTALMGSLRKHQQTVSDFIFRCGKLKPKVQAYEAEASSKTAQVKKLPLALGLSDVPTITPRPLNSDTSISPL